jgi:hypothetical protein
MLSKPRFVNPHFLPTSTVIVARKDAFPNDGEIESGSQTTDPLVVQLNQLIQSSVETRTIVSELPCASVGSDEPLCALCTSFILAHCADTRKCKYSD